MHYVSVYATFVEHLTRNECYDENGNIMTSKIVQKASLNFSLMQNEESLSAEEYDKFLTFVLSLFSWKMSNIFTITAENCTTNRSKPPRNGSTCLRCHAFRFNLYVQEITEQDQYEITKVQALMKQLRFENSATKL